MTRKSNEIKFFKDSEIVLSKGSDRLLLSSVKKAATFGAMAALAFSVSFVNKAEAGDNKFLYVLGGLAAGAIIQQQTGIMDNVIPKMGVVRNRQYVQPQRYYDQPYEDPRFIDRQQYRALPMAREMEMAVRIAVANNIRNTYEADSYVDNAKYIGENCVQQGRINCVVAGNGVRLDFSKGQYVAKINGRVVATQTNGMVSTDDAALRRAFHNAEIIKRDVDMELDGPRVYRR